MSAFPIDELSDRFQHHPPDPDRAETHQWIRETLLDVALELSSEMPAGREAALAITKLEEAMFWANAAIAREQA